MQLVINTPGSYLRKKEGNFLVKNDDQTFEVSAKKVQSIMITTGAYLSTDAIKLAMDNNYRCDLPGRIRRGGSLMQLTSGSLFLPFIFPLP